MRLALILTLALAGCAGPSAPPPSADDPGLEDPLALQDRDFDAAAQDFARRIAEEDARGWPAHVTRDEYGKLMASVVGLRDATRELLDADRLRQALEHRLVDGGVLSLAARPDPEVALLVDGLIEGARSAREYTITLTLTDARSRRVLLSSTTRVRKGEER